MGLRQACGAFVLAVGVGASAGAAATTYVYVGQSYTDVQGLGGGSAVPLPPPYDSSMMVTGRFSSPARLPAGLAELTDIGPGGLNLVQDWSFNDGVHAYAAGNSAFAPANPGSPVPSGASVTTDGAGNISGYFLGIFAPLPPHVVEQKMDVLSLLNGLGQANDGIAHEAPCKMVANDFCAYADVSVGGESQYFQTRGAGRWSSFDPLPDSGEALAGADSVAIAGVAGNDGVNGSPAVLGAGGNAVVLAKEGWPAGIRLDPGTGAVSVSAATAAGVYALTYQLCDSQSPLACVEVPATVTVKAAPPVAPQAPTPVPVLGAWARALLGVALALLGLYGLGRRS